MAEQNLSNRSSYTNKNIFKILQLSKVKVIKIYLVIL